MHCNMQINTYNVCMYILYISIQFIVEKACEFYYITSYGSIALYLMTAEVPLVGL